MFHVIFPALLATVTNQTAGGAEHLLGTERQAVGRVGLAGTEAGKVKKKIKKI
jgi:hypothetical protein